MRSICKTVVHKKVTLSTVKEKEVIDIITLDYMPTLQEIKSIKEKNKLDILFISNTEDIKNKYEMSGETFLKYATEVKN